ncbi:Uncharacterised protein [Klebsiella variicola]|nr:Uncharacterised protein [Klebsiella variicola]VGG97775.1 Uncharacterised protein [Klebsiella quasipneumoniae]
MALLITKKCINCDMCAIAKFTIKIQTIIFLCYLLCC